MIVLQIVEDLVIREGSEDRSHSHLFIFDSLGSRSFTMPRRIQIMEHHLIDLVMIRFHIGDGLRVVVRDTTQLQILHVA